MEVDEPSYDIFEWFPVLVCQNVFKYLEGKDVIQASAVNKEWRKFSGESKQMKKVKLVFDEILSPKLNRESVNMIKKSKREYHNIEIRGISDRFKQYIPEVLAKRAGSWKSVKISYCKIYDKEVWTEIFDIIEPSVEELSITISHLVINPERWLDADPKWTFPCLKYLEGYYAADYAVFAHCTSLVKLNWKSYNRQTAEAKMKLLCNNHKLEDLAVTIDGISLEDVVDFKFKLKKFWLHRTHSNIGLDITRSFLETQAQTLESLKLHREFNRDCLEVILSMPRLTSLSTGFVKMEEAISDRTLPLTGNTSITLLELTGGFPSRTHQNSFATLFRAFTSLKQFKCDQIDSPKFLDLAQVVPALQSFEANYFYISRFPDGDIFPGMKEFKVKKFDPNLPEATGDGNFASLARAEMRKIRQTQCH